MSTNKKPEPKSYDATISEKGFRFTEQRRAVYDALMGKLDHPTAVEVFECCINGQEIAPAYTEQNDPIEQRERLEHQAGGEQQKLDEDFLIALEHGMPPAGGMGLGIDRLCMMLLGQESIRDVILFPQLKPK